MQSVGMQKQRNAKARSAKAEKCKAKNSKSQEMQKLINPEAQKCKS